MDILIVYGSQSGTTERLARTMGDALSTDHRVWVMRPQAAAAVVGAGVDLLIVGTPARLHGVRMLVGPFLAGLGERGFRDVAAAAFDTRIPGRIERTGPAAVNVARQLTAAGCRLVRPPEGFLVAGLRGPLVEGEVSRSARWARDVAAAATPLAGAWR